MRRERFVRRPLSDRPAAPFASAEAAWLWFWQCQTMREVGARFVADAGPTARPCDPDDIYRVAAALYRRRRLRLRHVQVLAAYGRRLMPPDARLPEERAHAEDWQDALDLIEPALIAKRIVAEPVPADAPAAAMGEARS